MSENSGELIRVGSILKPYGLFGELKVRPETFDFDRHELLKKVFCRKFGGEAEAYTVASTRRDGEFWYLKFEGLRSPEAAAELSGRELLVGPEDRLELPPDLVFHSDLPGMKVRDELGNEAGTIAGVMETGAIEYLVMETGKGEVPLPWNGNFVKRIDPKTRIVYVDLSMLRGVLL